MKRSSGHSEQGQRRNVDEFSREFVVVVATSSVVFVVAWVVALLTGRDGTFALLSAMFAELIIAPWVLMFYRGRR